LTKKNSAGWNSASWPDKFFHTDGLLTPEAGITFAHNPTLFLATEFTFRNPHSYRESTPFFLKLKNSVYEKVLFLSPSAECSGLSDYCFHFSGCSYCNSFDLGQINNKPYMNV
jgi:hypothetical protein